MESLATLQNFGQEKLEALKNISKDPQNLRTAGFIVVAATTGAVAGVLVAKGLLAAKGVVAAQATLATKGGATAAAPSAAQSGAALLQQATANGAAALQNANTLLNSLTTNSTALLNNATGLVNSATVGGATLSHQVAALLNTLTNNALPLTAGAVGGGAVGVGVTQQKVRHLQVRFNEQVAQAEVYQAETNRLQTALADAEAKISASELKATSTETPQPAPGPVVKPVPDQLEQIRGIGPVFARRLNAAGIFTFADLAAQTPEQLQAIMAGVRANRMFHPQDWIDQARQLAAAPPGKTTTPSTSLESSQTAPDAAIALDRLEALAGLTPLYASRLNAAGILTYADLAAQTPARVQQISGATEDVVTVQAWITAAQALCR
ncbi:MAG: helix-hairpin-helix domain-containing protein [Caldilineaceae bacterium]